MMTHYPVCALLIVLLAACQSEPPPPVPAAPSVEDTVVQDQIEHTRLHTPEAPPPEAPQTVRAQSVAPVAREVAPPPPTNLAPAPAPKKNTEAQPHPDAPDHTIWNELLQQYVDENGRVDYGGFEKGEGQLNQYLDRLANASPTDAWSRNEALAYWINAYNAFTVKLILDNRPLSSIRDIEEPWARKWIELDGKTYSLDDIEHGIIRPTYREPRIHFALVCAAASCPPLPDRAFTANNLERMLEDRTRSFIRDEEFNVTQEEVVRVSPLFDWYAEDFGDLRTYLNTYLRTPIPEGKQITFLDYDWSLND